VAERHPLIEACLQRSRRADHDAAVVAVDEYGIALFRDVTDVGQAPDDGHAHRSGDDRHVGGQRAFLEHDCLQPPLVIFQ